MYALNACLWRMHAYPRVDASCSYKRNRTNIYNIIYMMYAYIYNIYIMAAIYIYIFVYISCRICIFYIISHCPACTGCVQTHAACMLWAPLTF